MPVLKGTNVSPLDTMSPLNRVDARVSSRKVAIEKMEAELFTWNRLKKTEMYKVLCDLCDPKIEYFRTELAKCVGDFPGWPVDALKEYRAECRGSLKQWLAIRDTPGSLKTELESLEAQETEESERAEKGGDKGEPTEATKKVLKKFT